MYILAAEFEAKAEAERFAQALGPLHFTSLDGNIESDFTPELLEDRDANWWCAVLIEQMDWESINKQEENYRTLELASIDAYLAAQLTHLPHFRYALRGPLNKISVDRLVGKLGDDQATYSALFPADMPGKLNIPITVLILRPAIMLSEQLWLQAGSPEKFELKNGYYVRLQGGSLMSGGIAAPPVGVIRGTTMRIVVEPDKAEELVDQARELITSHDYAEALILLQQAQKINPLSADVHFLRGAAMYGLERYDEALAALQAALLVSPSHFTLVLLYQLRGDVLKLQGKPVEALASFDESLKLKPDDDRLGRPLMQRAYLLKELGRPAEALESCEGALRLWPTYEPLLTLRAKLQAQLSLGEKPTPAPNKPLPTMGILRIVRTSAYADKLRAYKILVDGTTVGEISEEQTLDFPVNACEHEVTVQLGWCSSNTIRFLAVPGKTVSLEAASNLQGQGGLQSLVTAVLHRSEYLILKKLEKA